MRGADCIDDLDVIRHGGMTQLFADVYAHSTLGSFLRAFTYGHTRQLAVVARRFLVELARRQCASFGHAKVGGYPVRLRGLSSPAAVIFTPIAAPVIAGMRLRGGSAGSSRGAASLLAEALSTARATGATGEVLARADSAFYAGAVISVAMPGDELARLWLPPMNAGSQVLAGPRYASPSTSRSGWGSRLGTGP